MPHEDIISPSSPLKKKPPRGVHVAPQDKILVGKNEGAEMLSISPRAIDYLISTRQLSVRRIGARVLIPTAELKKFSRSDHPDRLAG